MRSALDVTQPRTVGDREKRTRTENMLLAGAGVVTVCALLLMCYVAPPIKQAMLPRHATPEAIEQRFQPQISTLVGLADGTIEHDEEATTVFDDPDVHGAYVISCFDRGGKGLLTVKSYTPLYYRAAKRGSWFVAEPTLRRPVVNIWGNRVAVYEKVFRREDGKVKGCHLVLDLEALRRTPRSE